MKKVIVFLILALICGMIGYIIKSSGSVINLEGRSNTVKSQNTESGVYPTLATSTALLSSTSTSWALGVYTTIIPEDTITSRFTVKNLIIGQLSATTDYEMVLYSSSSSGLVELGRTRFIQPSSAGLKPLIPINTPIVVANTEIGAKLASETASSTASTSLMYWTY